MGPVISVITAFSQGIVEGDLRAALSHFEFPMAIFAEGDIVVCPDAHRLASVFGTLHDRLAAAGARSVEVSPMAVPLCRGQTGTVWAERIFRDAAGTAVAVCRARYFFRLSDGTARICMIECLSQTSAAALSCLSRRRAA